MTREAKIGMLTGLGVILLIGVLLSNYLGPGTLPTAGARMAVLPIGGAYRQQMMQPVTAPGLLPDSPSTGSAVAFASNDDAGPALVPALYASNTPDSTPVSGPTVGRAVTPVAAGPAPAGAPAAGSLPTIALADATAAAPAVPNTTAQPVKAATTSTTYVIVSGDTLMKIARKFYGAGASSSDVQRIVAANPAVLKDANTMLTIGKKLAIANVPVTPMHTAPKQAPPTVAAKPDAPLMISLPGSPDAKAPAVGVTPATPADTAKKESKTYVVQAGDTLEKIARKFAPTNSSQLVVKLKSVNAIKDPNALQIGTTLKVPV